LIESQRGGAGDGASPLRELLELSSSLLEGPFEFNDVRALNSTIGRFADLYAAVYNWAPISADDLINLVYLYADYRLIGSADSDGNDPLGLGWKPVKWSTFENDLRHLRTYSEWCSSRYGYLPILPMCRVDTSAGKAPRTLAAMEKMRRRDFFAHLAKRRRTWAEILPKQDRPKISLRRQERRRRGTDEAIDLGFIRDLIESERNPVYKAIWTLGAWGGVRISEQLNMWACDVLPPSQRPRFFPGDDDDRTPLVLIAHPWESTWCGTLKNTKMTRAQFLRSEFGLIPRPDLGPRGSGEQSNWMGEAGFKGVAFHNKSRLVSQVYWLDETMAAHYYELVRLVLERHLERRQTFSNRHPFLWCVTDPRKPDIIGNPLRMKAVESAFDRACNRLGLKAHEGGLNIHGLRHFFLSYAKNVLGLGRDVRQVLMHHRSTESQDDYGWEDNQRIRVHIQNGYDSLRQQKALISA
jgi:integrase